MTSPYSRLQGTGSYLPERVLSNDEISQRVDTSDEWIVARTGIHSRHIAAADEGVVDMATVAARRALEAAGLGADALDLIVVATTTPDQIFPSTACLLQSRLGNRGAAAFDVQAVCTGFIYALATADRFIRSGGARHALVVGVEKMSRIVDWDDRSTCILFGDGAGAVVLSASDVPGILSTHLHADGRYADLLQVPVDADYLTMQGNAVFRMAVRTLEEIVQETLVANDLEGSDIDWLVPHQANIRIIQATADKLGLPMERVVTTVAHHGNVSAASVPLALDDAARRHCFRPGQRLLLEAFGGGFTWGSALLRWL
ncbi:MULTISPECIES: beta-ketoacyl-ACP synthase III [Acidithiobacillus]|uniref:Beta-ketoacyl-[acyl-carrier-protein] synthase III n=3 Tax=Acidithiobacillus caldus TaxID=33059 RepID=F9ZL77_ACICS|nr:MULTISPECIES: beta-ketoacyl-ACP synthase III [Acidithiobacillus]AEK57663.1 3-oxoacyl-[acyl-carrier-protein] synthase, KASIII [Acidithiobacillus caldus SM-1]AIA54872.1 3-oxoacyl-(acyl-carrier-protein) synthase, KASIII [Acidithiobacillus caldus ATCC 51756]AUW32354.1 ketoacyl-ACP synthase III [Acidithiobacillus caldus]MBU2730843.1 ketoacyl-ACP synthase III [Acidithiobacillus caldus]MBU2735110.1 ketoacyl-ACP synthase III [Acidithiobacillus caldus ATCC 51756]